MTTVPVSRISLDDVAAGARLLTALPVFLRRRIRGEEALGIVQLRLERRKADFLTVVHQAVYGNSGSPYRNLLKYAGCEYGDFERLVKREGVEGTLRILFRSGVFLTVDEFKGRRPAVRGSATIEVRPALLRNPLAAFQVAARSNGSRSSGTPVYIDLAFVRDCAVNLCLFLEALGGASWHKSTWEVPGGGAMFRLLKLSAFGRPAARWFSQVAPDAPGLHPRYRWSARALRWGSLLAGVPLPGPRFVPLEDPLPIARWMTDVLRAGGTPYLGTFPSSAVRLCQAALEAGFDLQGAQLLASGEPFTDTRRAVIRRAGAEPLHRYGSIESGPVGYGCLEPEVADDVHLLRDLHAVVQPAADAWQASLPPEALLISSLRASAPFVMLNVSMGDQARIVSHSCGCALERLGWTTHLHTIRSFEKLTAGGMTFLDTDILPVLDEILPARFGGGPTDYQLLEEEADDGRPRLRLLVHPTIGSIDPEAVAEVFLSAIGSGCGAERVMELQWRGAGLLRVERKSPVATAGGKILHVHSSPRARNVKSSPALAETTKSLSGLPCATSQEFK